MSILPLSLALSLLLACTGPAPAPLTSAATTIDTTPAGVLPTVTPVPPAEPAVVDAITATTPPTSLPSEKSEPKSPQAASTPPQTSTIDHPPSSIQYPASSIQHESWNTLLSKYVGASGKVNYAGFKADRAALDAYLQTLAANAPQADWPRAEKMAYWINAYNAFTIQLILDNYPVSSITKLDGGKPWDVKRITLGGKKYSLNDIENDILRPQFKDARIHFALNCAAKSCPPLYNRAFTAGNLEKSLESRTRQFINNTAFNTLAAERVQVSKIFDWYAVDFGNVPQFLNKYASTKVGENAEVQFADYDWALND